MSLRFDALLAEHGLLEQWRRVSGGSRFATDLCLRKPALMQELVESGDLQRSYAEHELSDALRDALRGCESQDELGHCLRVFRQREMLRILWRDFTRQAHTMETTRDTSLLAECCIAQSLDFLHRGLAHKHGEPRNREGVVQRMVVIAMGKLGARELNLSSDIDLIFSYPEAGDTDGESRPLSNQEFFIKLGQQLIAALDKATVEGFVFRVDMRLRPYGDSGALVVNFSAMEEYYQDQGRDWERYALIKARVVAGDPVLGASLMANLRPFIYRRYIDFGVIESLRDMKQMINAEVRRRGLQADVKLGHGGIREVEFIAQCIQLIRGGRSKALRQRELLSALQACADEECLPESAVAELRDAYLFLRDTEHAIQGYEDKQTQALPATDEARSALLVAMGFPDWQSFSAVLEAHRKRVSVHFDALIAPVEALQEDDDAESPWPGHLDSEQLATMGYDDPVAACKALVELRDSGRLKHLQAEGRERLDQFMPRLIAACSVQENATVCLLRTLALVQAVARRSAYLVLLLENPKALDELVQLCAASPWISELLSRSPVLLDQLLDTRSLYSTPDRDEMISELQQQLARLAPDDLEANMEALRYFRSSKLLHIAASEVSGRLPLMKVSDKLTYLAEVILERALQLAWYDLSSRYGRPQREGDGYGFMVLGYGKLGGLELGHGSDLDLVFVYDAKAQGHTDGERSIENSVFYTRLGQRIIHILDARTAMGQLYQIDMRLRPSGESGLLVTSLAAYRDYQLNSAWTWEHQALVRARTITGDAALAEQFSALRREVLSKPRDERELAAEVVGMREKMRNHLLSAGALEKGQFDLKQERGGIVDIEFMVQFCVLAWSSRVAALTRWTDNVRILETLAQEELISDADAQALTNAYLVYRSASHRLALQQNPGVADPAGFVEEREAVVRCWEALLGAPA